MSNAYAALRASFSPVATWRLGESSGVSAADSTGNGHTGTYSNSSGTLVGVTLGQPGAITGDTNTAALFNGSSGFVSVLDSASLRLTRFSIEAWIKPTNVGGNGVIVCKGTNTGASLNYYMDLLGGPPRLFITQGGSYVGFTGNSAPSAGQYHHMFGTYNGTVLALYLDGQPNGTLSASGNPDMGTSILAIGESGPDNTDFFGGAVDEVSVYPSGLTATNVLALYNAAIATNPALSSGGLNLGTGLSL